MNTEDIIGMAREAGLFTHKEVQPEIERFAALVEAAARADEREACAKVCEMQENRIVQTHPARVEFDPNSMMARKCAAAIRARNQS
jgi:hypothetical protein